MNRYIVGGAVVKTTPILLFLIFIGIMMKSVWIPLAILASSVLFFVILVVTQIIGDNLIDKGYGKEFEELRKRIQERLNKDLKEFKNVPQLIKTTKKTVKKVVKATTSTSPHFKNTKPAQRKSPSLKKA